MAYLSETDRQQMFVAFLAGASVEDIGQGGMFSRRHVETVIRREVLRALEQWRASQPDVVDVPPVAMN